MLVSRLASSGTVTLLRRAMSNKVVRQIIHSDKAPKAVGAYSQAVLVNDTLYISGSLGLDGATGEMVSGGVEAECRQSLTNIGHVLEAAGATFDNVVKVSVLLADINDFVTMNNVYKEFFTKNFPARAAYQVANLPKGARVEIEAVAVVGEIVDKNLLSTAVTPSNVIEPRHIGWDNLSTELRAMSHKIVREIIVTDKAPQTPLPLNQAVRVNDTLYISGTLGINPQTGKMVSGGIEGECRQALTNMGHVLKAAGATFDNVVKVTVLLADINDSPSMSNVYREFFTKNYPARAAYQVAHLPMNARVEIEAIAVVGEIVTKSKL